MKCALPLLLLTSISCTGLIGDQRGSASTHSPDDGVPRISTPPGTLPKAYVCDTGNQGLSSRPRRLSNAELLATFTSIFGADVTGTPEFAAKFQLVPNELSNDPGINFDNANVSLTALLGVAEYLAGKVVSDATVRTRVLGTCAKTTDASCIDGLITRFARRAYRGTLDQDASTRLRSHVSEIGGAEGLRYAIMRVLVAPETTQLLDREVEDDSAELTVRLSGRDVASRLAFYVTGGPPDDALLDAAEAGELETTDDVAAHAKRLLATPNARTKLRSAVRDWLGKVGVADPAPAVASALGISATGFGAEAEGELLDFVEHVVFTKHGTFADLLTDKTAFAKTDRMAKVYGLSTSTQPQQFDDVRGGVILRAATLLSGIARTSPIYRGVYVRDRILCGDLPGPTTESLAAGQAAIAALSPAEHSNREIIAYATQSAGCQACHSLINPLGYTLESLGPAGEVRAQEVVFADDGSVVARHAIDTKVDDLNVSTAVVPAVGADDLVHALAQLDVVRACFTSHFIANTRMRPPTDADGCAGSAMVESLARGATIEDAIVANVATDDIFLRAKD